MSTSVATVREIAQLRICDLLNKKMLISRYFGIGPKPMGTFEKMLNRRKVAKAIESVVGYGWPHGSFISALIRIETLVRHIEEDLNRIDYMEGL